MIKSKTVPRLHGHGIDPVTDVVEVVGNSPDSDVLGQGMLLSESSPIDVYGLVRILVEVVKSQHGIGLINGLDNDA